MAPRKLHGVLLLLLQSLPPLLLLLPTPIAGQQSKAGMDFKSWPREDPGHLEGYCPTRGGRARDWMAGDLEGCTMLDLYSQGLNATTMTELSIILALHGPPAQLARAACCSRRCSHCWLLAAGCWRLLAAAIQRFSPRKHGVF
jgi:hypothetical protein